MHLHHLPLHLRQNGHATTKRQQRKLGEDQRQRNQNPAHDGHRHISSMLSGASTSMVGNSGRRSQAMAISASATIASAGHLRAAAAAS